MTDLYQKLVTDLESVLRKHKVALEGKIRICAPDRFKAATSLSFQETIEVNVGVHTCRDESGPFILLTAEEKPLARAAFTKLSYDSAMLNIDKDKLLREGIASPLDKSIHTNRKSYNDHLRAHGCREVGNDYNNAKPKEWEHVSDASIKDSVAQAVHEVFDRHNIKTLR